MRRRRLDLGLAQRTLAGQLGVREETIRLWEADRVRPLPRHYGRIVRFLDYDPQKAGPGLGERIRAARRRCGFTQAELAEVLGVDEGTVVDLESGRRRPSGRIAAAVGRFLGTSDEPPDPHRH